MYEEEILGAARKESVLGPRGTSRTAFQARSAGAQAIWEESLQRNSGRVESGEMTQSSPACFCSLITTYNFSSRESGTFFWYLQIQQSCTAHIQRHTKMHTHAHAESKHPYT